MSLQAATDFSLSMLKKTNVEESIVISPLSVALAFAMIHAGAGGKSMKEICRVIAKGASDAQLLEYYESVSQDLLSFSEGEGEVQIKLANRIYIHNSFKLNQDYLHKIKEHFNAEAANLDFHNGKKCSEIVNDFVEETTDGKIKDTVQPAMFCGAVFLLINAIYFTGEWQMKFSPDFYSRNFDVKKGVTKMLSFMNLSRTCHDYVETDKFQILSKNYKDENFKFIVVLPKKKFGLAAVRKNLDAKKLLSLFDRLHLHCLDIHIPKFTIETTTELVDLLKKLGIKEVFSSSANLNGIAPGVEISDAFHKAYIEVDENGTKAAAVTCVFGKKKSKPPKVTKFIADHPFLYFLTHKKNILFCGQFNG